MSAEIIAFRKREKPKDKPVVPPPSRRLEALDALRGVCVIGMIVLTALGAPESTGFGPDHLLSAGFLVCMGMAIPLSLAGRAARQGRGRLTLHIGLRTLILVALGVGLSNAPYFDPAHLIWVGPLQFAGLSYGLAAIICLSLGRKSDADFSLSARLAMAVGAGVLAVYAGLLTFGPSLPIPFDPALDPLGLTSLLGGLGAVMLGVLAALYVRKHGMRNALAGLGFLGVLLVVVGGSLAKAVPVNGAVWSPSFVLLAGGLALVVLALVAAVNEISAVKVVTYPLRVFGGNALLAFVATMVVAWLVPMLGEEIQTPEVYAGALLLIVGLPLWGLYRQRIFLKP